MLNWLISLFSLALQNSLLVSDLIRLYAPFFPSIAEFMMSGPSVIGIISGPGVIKSWRDMMGATNPGDAATGTIRGDFATAPDGDMIPNIVHGSDSEESAARGIKIWFGE